MMPIVNGLEAEFGDSLQFVYLNAEDGADGQQTFTMMSLPGHPSYIVFLPTAEEVYRSFGMVNVDTLRAAIANALMNGISTDRP
jgi:hypothetical protein